MASVTFSSLMPRSSLIDLAAGEDRDVLQHGLAAIAEARRLHRRDLEAAAQLVDHQGRQRLALDVLGDDQQRLAGLHHCFQQRQQSAAGRTASSRGSGCRGLRARRVIFSALVMKYGEM